MAFVENIKDIENNINTLDEYLKQTGTSNYEYACDLVRRGRCFISVKKPSGYAFYPSRFIGYKDNNRNYHESNTERDGRLTNPEITKILGHALFESAELEKEYFSYCKK